MPNPGSSPANTSWWKPTPDTIAAYLSIDESKRLLAGSSLQAPDAWQRRARATLGERLGRLIAGVARTTMSITTLGLSEVMYRLSQPGALAAAPNVPPLDLVVGPHEAAVLIVDGAVAEVMTADRAQTHDFWDRLSGIVSRGPHLEVVMIDLAPSRLTLPLTLQVGLDELACEVDAEVAFSRAVLEKSLALLSRIRVLRESDLNAQASDSGRASFATVSTLAQALQRRLQAKSAAFQCARGDAARLRTDATSLTAAQAEVTQFLNEELFAFGLAVQRCHLLVGRSAAEDLEIARRKNEIEQSRRSMEADIQRIEMRRRQELDRERQQIELEQKLDQSQGQSRLGQANEGYRFAMARMVLQNDADLAVIERDGFAKRRESERLQEQLDAQQAQMLQSQAHTADLQRQLAGAQNELEVQRIKMQIETERLKLASLAQEQNLTNLRRIKEIEREDALARSRDAAEMERARFAAAGTLSPEQMLAAMADKNPEIAKALAAKFANDGSHAQRNAAEQIQLMQKMQAEMASIMREGLQANAQVARGMVDVTIRSTNACTHCGKALQPQWKACPYCGGAS
jgi:hypothetical protein